MKYELTPTNGRKSFNGKAYIEIENNSEVLLSYGTRIMRKLENGTFKRLFNGTTYDGKEVGITNTTLSHIKAFSGLNKSQFLNLEMEDTTC